MPMNSEARRPSTDSMMTKTSRTAVMHAVLQLVQHDADVFDLSCVKVTWTVAGQVLRRSSTTFFVASTVSTRFAPLRFDTSMAIAGLPLTRVIEFGSLKVGRTCATSLELAPPRPPTRRPGSSGCPPAFRSVPDLHRETAPSPRWRRRRPGCCRAWTPDQLVERDAVALQQHRLGDDLDRLVARARSSADEHAGHLLDGGLAPPRRAVSSVARARRRRARRRARGRARGSSPARSARRRRVGRSLLASSTLARTSASARRRSKPASNSSST